MSHRPGYTRENSVDHTNATYPPIAHLTDHESIHSSKESDVKSLKGDKDKEAGIEPVVYEAEVEDLEHEDITDQNEKVMETALDFSMKLKTLDDDPTLPVWTFRMWFLGLGFTAFAAVLGQIYYFRPQTVYVSSLFIVILSFVTGNLMAVALPGEAFFGKHFGEPGKKFGHFINPGPFNVKEHVTIMIMSSTATSSATAISVFATDELFYNIEPNYGVAIFALIGSQLLGYGLAGLSRSYTVYPTFALWPSNFSYTALFDTLHSKHVAGAMAKRWRFFWIFFGCVFVWEWFPEYIAPTLTGVSIFCLARQNSPWVTRIFGGANGNEGFGVFSLCFDWYYVGSSPFYTPLNTQINQWAGWGLCIMLNCALYQTNLWKAQNFPWLSQDLFYENGTVYDQTLILDSNYDLNQTALDIQGIPYFTMTNALYYLGNNMAVGAQFSFVALFYHKQIIEAWKQFRSNTVVDPHYQKMLVYKEVPMWWYGATLLGSFACAMATCYGGANGNEGFGVFSLCFDWYYVGSSPFYTPLNTQINQWAGWGLCIMLNCALYQTNLWKAQNFPWLSQDLFYENGTVYDQTLILDSNYDLNQTALDIQGIPYFTMTNALYYLGNNMAVGAQFSFVALFYHKQIIEAWKQFRSNTVVDPHYQKMLVYKEVPMWWYGATLLGSFACAMATCYAGHSHLPWWALIVAILISAITVPFIAVLGAITGFSVGFGNVAQLIGGEILPGNPQTNLWFTLYGGTVSTQAVALLSDLKLGQYMKLPPRVTFTAQMIGTVIGGILQIIMCKTIIANQREILLSVEGTNIWNGQNVQSYNSQAISWGALAKPMYGAGSTYQIIPIAIAIGFVIPFFFYAAHRFRPKWGFDKVLVPTCWYIGDLSVGVNSQIFFIIVAGAISQLYVRRKHPGFFRKYNYLMCGAIDGGYQFIATFAVQGGAGTAHPFPTWALNPSGNLDYCMQLDS